MDMVVVLPKRRPGRPRKIKVEFSDEEELPFNYLMKVKSDADDGDNDVDESKCGVSEVEIIEVPKKKRGRPPLDASKQTPVKSEYRIKKRKHSASSTDDEEYTPYQSIKTKRTVGRLSKPAQKKEQSDITINGETLKRRPGRPRKLLNGAAVQYASYDKPERRAASKYVHGDNVSSFEEEIENEGDDDYDEFADDADEWASSRKYKKNISKSQAKKLRRRRHRDENEGFNSDDELSHCVPNGFKLIQCLLCGEHMQKIHILRQHIQLHAQGEDMDDKILESAPIYEHLNPHKRDIDTPVMREFIMKEIRGQRTSEFYVILTEAEQELHFSDSETDSASGEFDEETDCITFPKKVIPRNVYKCELCDTGITFSRRYKADFHHRTMHSNVTELPVKCYICNKGFICAQLLTHHLKTQCERDNKPFPLIQRFWRHLAKSNLEQMRNMSQARKSLRPQPSGHVARDYECDVCHLRFVRPEHCIRHKRIHAPDALKFKCPRCPNRFFSRKDNLKLHMQVHLDVSQRTIKEKKILCAECGRSFNRHSNWVIHNRRHHTKEKPYACKVCGKCFVCSTDMKSHEQTHSNVRKHVCNVCGKSFGRANLLTKHMTVHDHTINADASLQIATNQRTEEECDDVTNTSVHVQEDEVVEEEEVAHIIKTIEIEYLE